MKKRGATFKHRSNVPVLFMQNPMTSIDADVILKMHLQFAWMIQ